MKILFLFLSLNMSWIQHKGDTSALFQHPIIHLTSDNHSFLYAADNNGTMFQLDSNLNILQTFSDFTKGSLTSFEVTNSFQLLAFQKEFNQFCFLTRFLTLTNCTVIPTFRKVNISHLTRSSDFDIWFYENDLFQITKFNFQTNQVSILFSISHHIDNDEVLLDIKEYQNYLYLLFDNNKILVLDQYGILSSKYENITTSKLIFNENNLLYIKNKKLYQLDIYSKKKKLVELDLNNQQNLTYLTKLKNNFYYFDNTKITKISIN